MCGEQDSVVQPLWQAGNAKMSEMRVSESESAFPARMSESHVSKPVLHVSEIRISETRQKCDRNPAFRNAFLLSDMRISERLWTSVFPQRDRNASGNTPFPSHVRKTADTSPERRPKLSDVTLTR
jgi:hypothetical protein